METGKNNNHITSSEDSLIQIKNENSCHRMFDSDTQTIHSKSSIDTNLQCEGLSSKDEGFPEIEGPYGKPVHCNNLDDMYAPEKSVARYVETPVGTFDVEYLRKHNLCIGCDSGPRGSSWEDVLNSNNEIVEDGKAMKYDTELPQTILDLLNCHPACHLSDDDNIREKIDIPIDTNNPLSLKGVLDGRLESYCTLGPHLDTLYKQSKMKTVISK